MKDFEKRMKMKTPCMVIITGEEDMITEEDSNRTDPLKGETKTNLKEMTTEGLVYKGMKDMEEIHIREMTEEIVITIGRKINLTVKDILIKTILKEMRIEEALVKTGMRTKGKEVQVHTSLIQLKMSIFVTRMLQNLQKKFW